MYISDKKLKGQPGYLPYKRTLEAAYGTQIVQISGDRKNGTEILMLNKISASLHWSIWLP